MWKGMDMLGPRAVGRVKSLSISCLCVLPACVYVHVDVFCLCVYMCTMHAPGACGGRKRAWMPGTGVTDGTEYQVLLGYSPQ